MIPPNVPLSVVARVIDILAEGKKWIDVKKFSALSAFCRDQCREHLFANIRVGEDDEDMYDDDDQVPVPPLEKFLALINNHPDTAPYVRHLCLVNVVDEDDQAALPLMLSKLIKMSCLEIFMFGEDDSSEWSNALSQSFQTLSTIPSLQRLVLRGIEEFPLKALAPLTQIQHLEFDHVGLAQHRSFKATSSPPQLHSLSVVDFDEFGADGKLGCLKMKRKDGKFLLDLSCLKSLNLGPFSGTSLKAACEVFRSQNIVRLEELLIGISDTEGNYANNLQDLVLPQRQTLKHLEFFSLHGQGKSDPYSKLYAVLNKLEPSNVLTSLRITVSVGFRFDLTVGEEWRTICDPLTKPGWQHLKSVTLKVHTFDDGIQNELQKLCNYLEPLFHQPFQFKLDFNAL